MAFAPIAALFLFLFLEPALPDRALVIVERRALLKESDRLRVKVESEIAKVERRPALPVFGVKASSL